MTNHNNNEMKLKKQSKTYEWREIPKEYSSILSCPNNDCIGIIPRIKRNYSIQ